jgi:hypothetical protein
MGFFNDWNDFGEGLWKAEKGLLKAAGGFAIGAVIVSTGGAALPLGVAVAAEGYCIKKATEKSDNEFLREFGDIVGESLIGGGSGAAVEGVAKGLKIVKVCKTCKK